MSHHYPDRQLAGFHHEPRFGRLLLASFGVHLAVVLLFSGGLLPRYQRDLRPVYHVDLVNLPVKSPQAGRPDAWPEPARAPAKPAAPEPAKASPPPKPAPKPQVVKVAKPEVAKPAAPPKKPVKASQKPSAADEKALQERLRKMQARQEIDDMKRRLAEMTAKDTRQAAAVPGAPAGMMDGRGTEAGSSYDAWLHEYLKQAWVLSRYQVLRRDLQATVTLAFDAQGNLLDYNFIKKSGEERFDDSVRKAILQLKKLPNSPGSRMEKEIVFNLKDLLE